MKRKLFAFDIDGTLLDTNNQPLDSTREALEKLRKQGHLVTIATGRSRFMAQNVMLDLDFSNYIVCNGAAGFLDHEQYFQNLLDETELARLTAEIEKRKLGLAYVGLDDIKKSNHYHSGQMTEALNTIGFDAPDFDENFQQENDIYQALAFYNETVKGELEKQFPRFRFIRWHDESVDVIPQNGSKAATLLTLADRVGIERENIIAFGDGGNDKEMLREVGIGVAMGNAQEHVKQEAKMITDTNDEDGIWKALKKLQAI